MKTVNEMNGHATGAKQPTAARTFHTAPATDHDYLHPFSYASGNDADISTLNLGNSTTDRTHWRLLDERGRQRWRYLRSTQEADDWPMNTFEKYALGLSTALPDLPPPKTPLDAARNGISFFGALQLEPGNWACEYGGPMFLLPGVVITWYVTSTPIPPEYRIEITNYLFARQHPVDGGWGLHVEGDSSVFGTSLNYTVLRLMGVDADDERMIKARACLHKLGGSTMGPHWTKFWLSVLGVYEWEGVNPVPPELWLVPDWLPIAPWRWWIHMRQVFLPMSYIWSKRYSHPLDSLTKSLRAELYTQPYDSIDWAAERNSISDYDNFHPKSPLLNTLNWVLVHIHIPYTRPEFLVKRAEEWVYELIEMEDDNTEFSNLGPVNGPMNTIARMIKEGRDSINVRHHLDRLHDFIWINKEGLFVNGTNGVQTWDTAFGIQAIVDCGLAQDPKCKPILLKALEFLEDQQFPEEVPEWQKCYRQRRKGAWGFSTREQGYVVSDCTSEALKSVLLLQQLEGEYPQLISDERAKQAVDVLLTMQNASGGFSSYEDRRGNPALLESLNAAEVFGGIMVEYDYPECTTAVLLALGTFTKLFPSYRQSEIVTVRQRAVDYVRSAQMADGSWYGSWGICFTYATMFALSALATVGETYANSERVRRACKFLIEHQSEDGGWGESYRSCETQKWCPHPDGSQVVQTAMAAIALMEGGLPKEEKEPLTKAMRLLMNRQQKNGEWLAEAIEGVFNKTCMISYPNYKFIFPIKALGTYSRLYGNETLV